MFSCFTANVCAVLCAMPPVNSGMEAAIDHLQELDAKNALTDVAWRVTRDSRVLNLTASSADTDGRVWRLRTNRTHTRLNGWWPQGSANDRRPDRSFADKSRSAARFKAYLQSDFETPAPETTFEKRTVVFSERLRWPDEWGSLDRLQAAGALIATRPFSNRLWKIQPADLSFQHEVRHPLDDDRVLVVRETQSDDSYRELWLSSNQEFRPERWMDVQRGEIVRQLDFEWSEDRTRQLTKWTAQVFDPNSGYHEFADATVIRFSNPSDYDPGVFSGTLNTVPVKSRSVDQTVTDRVRRTLQWLFGWSGLIVMTGFAIAIMVLRNYRRAHSRRE